MRFWIINRKSESFWNKCFNLTVSAYCVTVPYDIWIYMGRSYLAANSVSCVQSTNSLFPAPGFSPHWSFRWPTLGLRDKFHLKINPSDSTPFRGTDIDGIAMKSLFQLVLWSLKCNDSLEKKHVCSNLPFFPWSFQMVKLPFHEKISTPMATEYFLNMYQSCDLKLVPQIWRKSFPNLPLSLSPTALSMPLIKSAWPGSVTSLANPWTSWSNGTIHEDWETDWLQVTV